MKLPATVRRVRLRSVVTACLCLLCFVAIYRLLLTPVYRLEEYPTSPEFAYVYAPANQSGCAPLAVSGASVASLGLKAGRPLAVSDDTFAALGLPPARFTHLTADTADSFVVATAASYNHFAESVDAVASVQRHLPHKRIFYYDIGLSWSQRHTISKWCGVTLRKFDFSLYPTFVESLDIYSWKVLIIQQILRDHPGVLWLDASVRLFSDVRSAHATVVRNGGMSLFAASGHSNFAVTHPDMFAFIATDVARQKTTPQMDANHMLIYNTRLIYDAVLRWLYACALDERCIAPTRRLDCDFKPDRFAFFADCHRFDQTLVNVLLANHFDFDVKRYTSSGIAHVERRPTNRYTVRVC